MRSRVLSTRSIRSLAVVWSLVVWLLLLVPGGQVEPGFGVELPEWLAPWADKIIHGVLFLPLGLLLRSGAVAAGRTGLVVGGFALVTEASQLVVPGRSAEFSDVVGDLLGAGIGWWLVRERQPRSDRSRESE